MTALSAPETLSPRPSLIWGAALSLAAILWLWGQTLAPFAFEYPKAWQIPAARWIGGAIDWLVKDAAIGPIAFSDVTRFVAALIEQPYSAVLSILSTGLLSGEGSSAMQLWPPLPWIAVLGLFALLGFYAGGASLALTDGHLHGVHRGLRPMAKRDGYARVHHRGGAVGRGRRLCPWPCSLENPLARPGAETGAGPDANHAGLCLPGPDPDPLRLWPHLGHRRHPDLRHAADDADHHPRPAPRAG